jgi:hypothetical protein
MNKAMPSRPDTGKNLISVKVKREVISAGKETAKNLEITWDQFVQLCLEEKLRRQGVTWWESRDQKILREASGYNGKIGKIMDRDP